MTEHVHLWGIVGASALTRCLRCGVVEPDAEPVASESDQ